MNHAPGSWTKSPNGNVRDCADSKYVTIDLGAYYTVGAVTIWNYYADNRKYCGQKLATSTTGVFGSLDAKVVMNTGTKYGPMETVNGNTYTFQPRLARYVRYWSSRSNKNRGVHFVEINVMGIATPMPLLKSVNLDQKKGVSAKNGPGMRGTAKNLIDMNVNPSSWTKSPNGSSKGCTDSRYVTIDLGHFYAVSSVRVWNYYADGRRYCGQKLQLSTTGEFGKEAKTVMNHGSKYGPTEKKEGNLYKFKETVARYVRYYSARSNKNAGVHMVEIDV